MQLSDQDLAALGEAATSAALKAGELISSYSSKKLNVENKGGADSLASQVVTEVDLMAQELILEMLEKYSKLFDLGTLGEESPDNHERFEKDYFWCIDPIDGTLAFINQQHGYAVSIGLVSKSGEPVIGVIFDPLEKILYKAVKGQGAFRNGRKWTVQPAEGAPLYLVSDSSFQDHPSFNESISELKAISEDLGYNGFETQFKGGAALNACWVLEKAPACYFKYPKKKQGGGSLWDYAASACIYSEAGAWASNMHGEPLDLNRKDSTFMNHEGILYASAKEIADRITQIGAKLKQ
ncbi:inositol monophosphatase family protein [uncultured Sunxiuqinia sp.]|uniref:3'(2'),5'-bisphosphate nucleotidase CysQ family protein n=1 Tax=uncultured Sunxiuqinia sp. TaxID=1573825 RepID=UPI002AA88B7D|nr:inositol monophosphatase family protein [uncultured Sunxiuqinia sp.]